MRMEPPERPTRGKTAPNRLRKTDVFVAVACAEQVRAPGAVYVDLGFGMSPVTTVETFRRLRRLNPALRVVGVEIDPERVRAAQAHAVPGLEFRAGGFDLPLRSGERVAVLRACNVLRQYDEAEVAVALDRIGRRLPPGALVLEGTSDPPGRLLVFALHRREEEGVQRTGVVFAPRLRADLDPRGFRAVLPKAYIHHAEPGGAIDAFFTAWHAAWQRARRHAGDVRRLFAEAALHLAERHAHRVDRRPALLRRGFLLMGASWPHPDPGGAPPAGPGVA